jgi:homopolymeric O-antigen transport system permease protein
MNHSFPSDDPHPVTRFFRRIRTDIVMARRNWGFWNHLAAQHISLQYARSLIGPFWLTLTMGMQIVALTYLFTGLFGASLEIVAPWVTVGVIVWTFFSTSLNDSASILIVSKPYLLESDSSILGFVTSVIVRNLIISLHHLILLGILCVWFALWPDLNWLWLGLSIPLVILFTLGLSVILAISTARFRDIQRITESILMVGFFLTPVLWRPQELIRNEFIATYNPFTHLIAIIRDPILGQTPSPLSWYISAIATAICLIGAVYALGRFRNRIHFWI